MGRRLPPVGTLVLALGVMLLSAQPGFSVITRLTPLREVLASEQLIFTAKVHQLDSDKAVMTLQVAEDLKGKAPFRTLTVDLTPDSEGERQGHKTALLKRLAPGLTLIVFTSKRGKRHKAFAYTNGTWFQLIGQAGDESATIRWSFAHCEPYLRRTFKGTTVELHQVIVDGLADKKKPPEPDAKEPPGLGPEIKKACHAPARELLPRRKRHAAASGGREPPDGLTNQGAHVPRSPSSVRNLPGGVLFAVIPTFVIVGPLALLAALLPALFAGLALCMRRWLVLLSIASLNSTLYLLHSWFHAAIKDNWLGNSASLWAVMTLITLAGVYWSWRRQRALRAGTALAHAEGIILWAMTFVCAGNALASLPWFGHADGIQPVWTFEAQERGAIISSPALDEDHVYVAAIQGSGFSAYGAVYCLNRENGQALWRFDDDGAMQEVFSSSCLAAGRLYIGEGLHEHRGSRFYCLDAASGRKLWHFETASHIESSPCVAGGKVYFGAGEDGVYCLDAATGTPCWHFQENLHIDTDPKVVGNRLYAGSGVSRTQKDTQVFCLDAANGRVLWRHPTKLPVWGSPCLSGDHVFLGLGNGRYGESAEQPAGALLCVDTETGKEKWCYDVGDAVLMTPAAAGEFVYFGCRDGYGYCLRQDNGQLQWKVGLGSPVLARLIAGDNVVYAAASEGKVWRLDLHRGEPVWQFDVAKYAQRKVTIFASPAGDVGMEDERKRRLYVGATLDSTLGRRALLYCLEDPGIRPTAFPH